MHSSCCQGSSWCAQMWPQRASQEAEQLREEHRVGWLHHRERQVTVPGVSLLSVLYSPSLALSHFCSQSRRQLGRWSHGVTTASGVPWEGWVLGGTIQRCGLGEVPAGSGEARSLSSSSGWPWPPLTMQMLHSGMSVMFYTLKKEKGSRNANVTECHLI